MDWILTRPLLEIYDVIGGANVKMKIIFLIQTGVGILGNSSLLCLYSSMLLTGHKVRPTDLILNQMVLANLLVLLSKGIPQTVAAFALKYFLGDAGCKLVFYLHRVGRGVSLSTTCLLSIFQSIKLSPSNSRWLELKVRSPRYIGFFCFLIWILHLLLNIIVPLKISGSLNSRNVSVKRSYGLCSTLIPENFMHELHAVLFSFVDIICLGLMLWASGSMVLFLQRHKQRIQHIHSNSLSPKPSHEARATHTILILVSSFVSFYFLSSILTFYISVRVNPGLWLVTMSMLLASCFPTFSSFLLISRDTRVLQFCSFCWERKKNIFPICSHM
nr:vomeronasal type-1 receptor 1-like [Dasypus novemcinctus]